jgi:hypothetical protein
MTADIAIAVTAAILSAFTMSFLAELMVRVLEGKIKIR